MNVRVSKAELEEAKNAKYALSDGQVVHGPALAIWSIVVAIAGILLVLAGLATERSLGVPIGMALGFPLACLVGIVLATVGLGSRWMWRLAARERADLEGDKLSLVSTHLESTEARVAQLTEIVRELPEEPSAN